MSTQNLVPGVIVATRNKLTLVAIVLAFIFSGLGYVLFSQLAALFTPSSPQFALWLSRLGLLASFALAVGMLWRFRQVRSNIALALWLEGKIPELNYALISLVDGTAANSPYLAHIQTQVEQCLSKHRSKAVPSFEYLWQQYKRILIGLFTVGIAFQLMLAAGWHHKWQISSMSNVFGNDVPVNQLIDINGEIKPPAYTGWAVEQLTNPERISGLVGSHIYLLGKGNNQQINARLGEDAKLAALPHEDGWQISFHMPNQPEGLLLSDGLHRRVIILDPIPDNAPQAKLTLPAMDEERKNTSGSVSLKAVLQDDIGINKGWFEIIVARGPESGDWSFVEENVFSHSIQASTGQLSGELKLDKYHINLGDQLSIRAVVEDNNNVTGPGIGYSETRIIRFVRDIKKAEIEINPAPPQIDKDLMSLRMLIRETERLELRRPDLEDEQFQQAVTPLRRHTGNIRVKIQGFVNNASAGGTFEVPELLQYALDEMWEAYRWMTVSETDDALIHMRNAYEALQTLFNLTRYFLSGETIPALAKIDDVRLTGEEPVNATSRTNRQRKDTTRQQLLAKLTLLLSDPHASPELLKERLSLMQIAALKDLPHVSQDIEKLAQAISAQSDVSQAIADLRRALGGQAQVEPNLQNWVAPVGRLN